MSAAGGRVLVTGATGFLGRTSASILRARGHDVVTTSRGGDVDRHCDLEDTGALADLLDDVAPTAVVGCAVRPDFGSGALAAMYGVNVLAPAVIAGWAARAGAHVVHASATLVHGVGTAHIGPTTPLLPDTDYGRSKLLAEEVLAASGCDHASLRFCGIYGAGGPAHLGLNRAIDAAIGGAVPTVVATGRARRNYIHVDDAAAALAHAVETRLIGTHLAAGPEVLSIAEMMEIVCDVYLPGRVPARADGAEASDQVVEHDAALPVGRPMRQALSAR